MMSDTKMGVPVLYMSREMHMQVLVDMCEKERMAWATSLKADTKLMKATEDSRLKAAVAFRIEKKEILESCLNQCRGKAGLKVQKQETTNVLANS